MYYYYGYGTAAVIFQHRIFYNSSNAHAIEINFLTVTVFTGQAAIIFQPHHIVWVHRSYRSYRSYRMLSSTLTWKTFIILQALKHHYHFILFISMWPTYESCKHNAKRIKLHLCRLIHLLCRWKSIEFNISREFSIVEMVTVPTMSVKLRRTGRNECERNEERMKISIVTNIHIRLTRRHISENGMMVVLYFHDW